MFAAWAADHPDFAYTCWIPLIFFIIFSSYLRYVYNFVFESIEHLYYTSMYDVTNNKDKIKSEVADKLTSILIEDSSKDTKNIIKK